MRLKTAWKAFRSKESTLASRSSAMKTVSTTPCRIITVRSRLRRLSRRSHAFPLFPPSMLPRAVNNILKKRATGNKSKQQPPNTYPYNHLRLTCQIPVTSQVTTYMMTISFYSSKSRASLPRSNYNSSLFEGPGTQVTRKTILNAFTRARAWPCSIQDRIILTRWTHLVHQFNQA